LSSIEDNIVRAHYIQKAAAKFGVPLEAVTREVEKRGVNKSEVLKEEAPQPSKSRRELLEERLLVLAIGEPDIILDEELDKLLISPLALKIGKGIVEFYQETKSFDVTRFGESLADELKEGFAALVLGTELKPSPREIKLVKRELRELILKEKLANLSTKIASLEAQGNGDKLPSLEREFRELSRELSLYTKES
jgi:hypothetical protein